MANNFENPEVFMEVAKAAAEHYADSCAVKLLAFSENATYLVYDPATDEKLFVLRVGRPGYARSTTIHRLRLPIPFPQPMGPISRRLRRTG